HTASLPSLLSFFVLLLLRPPPTSPLFPYTTLFRSPLASLDAGLNIFSVILAWFILPIAAAILGSFLFERILKLYDSKTVFRYQRSEEHTSELQSRFDLVCRLLLEKKKRNKKYRTI